jgi:hypothetical protein
VRRRAPALLAVLVLVLAGCGGDGDGGGDGADATATATTPATTSTAAQAPGLTEHDRISSCLTGLGYKLTGGIAPNASDTDSADYQIVMDSSRGGGYIGFYKNASRAQRVVKQLRKNAKSFKGAAVENHGAVNIVWVDLPDKAARASVRGCLVD